MANKITKAVIPAAGLGTRMLPIARAVPKEALPVVDKPVISYLVDEAKKSGITDLLIITGRGKDCIEDYFDHSPEYESRLAAKKKFKAIEELHAACEGINVYFIRQQEANGLGHAISKARGFTGNEPFVVLYGDDLVDSEVPVCRQMMDVYENYGEKAVAGVKYVPDEWVEQYCSLDVESLGNNVYSVRTMIEKPKIEEKYSNLAILGRVLLTPDIYDILAETKPGAGNEIQLTDAMKTLAEQGKMNAVEFEGTRYDMGSKFGFMKANIELALKHPEISEEMRAYIKELAATL